LKTIGPIHQCRRKEIYQIDLKRYLHLLFSEFNFLLLTSKDSSNLELIYQENHTTGNICTSKADLPMQNTADLQSLAISGAIDYSRCSDQGDDGIDR
jgi:hypothetical protein